MSINQINELTQLIDRFYQFMEEDDFLKDDKRSLMILKKSRENLIERRYVVSIIAAMKAGKSTTFNALLGRDLLPNETDACTTAITEIKHSSAQGTEVRKIYKDGRVINITADKNYSLEQNFHRDVRESRAINDVPYIEKYYLESPILAIEKAKYRDLVQNFILIDTPGPNEAQVNGFDVIELQRVALEKLRDSDALIMLLDYQNYKTETNAMMLKNIFEHREDLKRDQNKIYFLINKIDTITAKDGTIDEIIHNIKDLICEYAPIIKDPQVFAFSAKQAQLARSFLNGTATEDMKSEMHRNYATKYSKEIEIDGEFHTIIPKPESYAGKLLEESGLLYVESHIIDRIFSNASVKLSENAIDRIQQIFGNTKSVIETQIEISKRNGDELFASVEDSKKRIEHLRREGERLKEIPKVEIGQLKEKINDILPTMLPQSRSLIDTYMPREFITGSDQNQLIEQVQSMQETVLQALQVLLNREADKIERLVLETQGVINDRLNKAFFELSEEANSVIGKRMNLQFQTFRMGDLDHTVVSDLYFEEKNIQTINNETDNEGSLIKDILKGAGIGLGSGLILPGIGNIAGAIVGGVVGLFKSLSNNRNETVHRLDLDPVKENLYEYVNNHVDKIINELTKDLSKSNSTYIQFVDGQLNLFTANLKNQLDKIVRDYEKNKGDLDRHLKHMSQISIELIKIEEEIKKIKNSPV